MGGARPGSNRRGSQPQPAEVFPGQARGKPRPPSPLRRLDLSARAATQGGRGRLARPAYGAVAGQGQVQGALAARAGAKGDHQRGRARGSIARAGFSLPRAQFAALLKWAPFRPAHVRVPGANRSAAGLYPRHHHGRRFGQRGFRADALLLCAGRGYPSLLRGADRARHRGSRRRALHAAHRRTPDSSRSADPGPPARDRREGILHPRADQSADHLCRLPGARRGAFGQRLPTGARQPGGLSTTLFAATRGPGWR